MKTDVQLYIKRPIYSWKQPYIYIHAKRSTYFWKNLIYVFLKRAIHVCFHSRHTTRSGLFSIFVDEKRPICVLKRDLCIHIKRPMYIGEKRSIHLKKDLCTYKKSPMCMFAYQRYDQIRPVQRVGRRKETYVHEKGLVHVKRDLYTYEERVIYTWKETYIRMKRALCVYFRTRGTTRSGRYSVLAGKHKFSRVSLLLNMLD